MQGNKALLFQKKSGFSSALIVVNLNLSRKMGYLLIFAAIKNKTYLIYYDIYNFNSWFKRAVRKVSY